MLDLYISLVSKYLIQFLGGPGPEISLPVDQFPPGIPVQLDVTVTTPGGQIRNSTVNFTPPLGW